MNRNGLIIRFEDYKKDPNKTLKKVLTLLKVQRTEEQINQAIDQSDYLVVKQVEDDLASKGLLQRKFNFASQPLEYNSYMNESLQKSFYSEFNELSQWLGYPLYGTTDKMPASVSEEWFNVMTKCILGGAKNHPQQQYLYDSLKQVSAKIAQVGSQQ